MMRRIRLIPLFIAIMIMLALPIAALGEENLLLNPGFEDIGSDGLPKGWYTDAYVNQAGYTVYSVDEQAYAGDRCAAINNIGMNDARFAQTVEVVPSGLYKLSGWIRVDEMVDSGRGANLSVEGVYVFSEGVYESDDEWHYVELYGETGEDQYEVTVFARVGGYSGESQGKAYFDELSLTEVKSIPGDKVAELWFRDNTPVHIDPVETEDAVEAKPFWPWLIVISAAYLALGAWMLSYVSLKKEVLRESRRTSVVFWLGITVAVAARLIVAHFVEGYQVDVNCFRSWGHTMASVGPVSFYQSTSFCDYTPAYIYVMGFADTLAGDGAKIGLTLTEAFYHKLVPILCDVIGAYLIYRFARREGFGRFQAELMGLFVAFNPAMFINSAAWCQIDSVLCLGLMIVAMLAVRRKWTVLLPVYVLCILIKPQALMLGPLGLMVILVEWIRHKEYTKPMLIGLGVSLIVAVAIVLPFSIHQPFGWLIEKYGNTLASYPYATVNTANFYYLFNANWTPIEHSSGSLPGLCLAIMTLGWGLVLLHRQRKMKLGWIEAALMFAFAAVYLVMGVLQVSWSVLGYTTMALAFAVILPMYLRSGNVRHVPLLGAVLFLILYVLGVKMHERYLFPALFLLALAYVLHRDKRILCLLAVLSCTMLINEGIVLDNSIRLGSNMGHLNEDTKALAMFISGVNVLCTGIGVWTAWRICVDQSEEHLQDTPTGVLPTTHYTERPRTLREFSVDHRLHWKRIDWVLMLAVTAVYSVICLCNLGSTKAPQNPWTSTAYDEAVVVDLGEVHENFSMLYFAQVSYQDFSVATSHDGNTWSDEYWAEMSQGQCFRWKYLAPSYENDNGTRQYSSVQDADDLQRLSGRYVRITAQQISLVLNEVIFRDLNGERIPAKVIGALNANAESPMLSDPANLLDEQDTLEGEPGWYNSTYFDEIYHARTAYEHLNGTQPYETSHPPLGKVIMSWFVGIFGMTPFGWRFAGALAGILMLPAMYLLGKQLTKRTDMAFAAMTLMALDCMHFTQTRIATIDSYPVLFIIFSYLFMLRFMQRDIVLQPLKKVLPDLALSGFFMGCSVSSKWIGAYAGIGLAVLYFWTCIRHLLLGAEARKMLRNKKGGDIALRQRGEKAWKRVIFLCLWCLLFFVAVPLGIYLLSYVPYFAYTHKENFADFLSMVWNANFGETYGMLAYHSTPGMGMNHPFYSPWYEWPLIKRPMYYAMASFVPEGYSYSIFCFGNPAVWIPGLAGVGATLWMWLKGHRYTLEGSGNLLHIRGTGWNVAPAFVLLGLLAQFLPWVLVPRGTYIYHYFASIPFLILAMVLLLQWVSERMPRTGRAILISYLAVCLMFFVAFYPYASGVLTPKWWLDFIKQFMRVYYA